MSIQFRNLGSVAPAGAINSSVTDMAQWLLLQLNKGKHGDVQIVSEGQLAQMHAPQMVMPEITAGRYPELPNFAAYGLGWMVQPYRGHILVQHGGGIDGFASNVALLPSVNGGIVVLSNISAPFPGIAVMLNVCDRLLGLDPVPWNDRLKQMLEQEKEAAQKAREQDGSQRVAGTRPSHPLESYTGDFTHPGYGTVSIRLEGDRLKATRGDLSIPLDHYHYDIFEAAFHISESEMRLKLSFSTGVKGDIDGFSAPLEPAVADIAFKRVAAQEMREKRFLERFVGAYEVAGVVVTINLKGDSVLQASLPGQPDYELVPYRDTEFTLKGFSGFSVAFKIDETGAVTAAVITQPNGVFTATRKDP